MYRLQKKFRPSGLFYPVEAHDFSFSLQSADLGREFLYLLFEVALRCLRVLLQFKMLLAVFFELPFPLR